MNNDDAKRQKFSWKAALLYKEGWLNGDLSPTALSPDPMVRPPGFVTAGPGTRVTFWDVRDLLMVRLIPLDLALLQQRPGDSVIYLFDSLPDPAYGNQAVGDSSSTMPPA